MTMRLRVDFIGLLLVGVWFREFAVQLFSRNRIKFLGWVLTGRWVGRTPRVLAKGAPSSVQLATGKFRSCG
jgi:hypothetical protein